MSCVYSAYTLFISVNPLSSGKNIVEGCCMDPLTVMPGRLSPLGIEIDAVVVRVPSHVIPVRKGCHRQWRRHRHARSLVSDTEYLLHRLLALRLDKLPRLVRHRRSDARK